MRELDCLNKADFVSSIQKERFVDGYDVTADTSSTDKWQFESGVALSFYTILAEKKADFTQLP